MHIWLEEFHGPEILVKQPEFRLELRNVSLCLSQLSTSGSEKTQQWWSLEHVKDSYNAMKECMFL